ncbi:MAG: ATPase [Betaproteobacteria bacterium HGW-Betaproteobacteria-7]|jgi:SpoVK/Ycf46/Vps4 family AAA+-type ATPase|nr:MAG: ATPase [Betaproteobacteria bacterium HGW-Betaproteobacteria-7]
MDDLARLEELLLQKQGLVIINSHEEQRVLSMLDRFALLNGRYVTTWSVTGGLCEGSTRKPVYNTDQIPDALRHILTSPDNSVYVFFDAHHFLADPTVIRLLKDLLALDSGRMLVMIAPEIELPGDLKKIAAVLEPKLPSKERVFQILKEEAAKWADRSGQKVSGSRESISLLTQHLSGLTESDVRKLCRMSIHDDGAITAADIGRVLRHKHQMMESAELLTLETNVPKLEEIGGLNRLKQWLGIRREVFIDPANSPGLPSPKGVLLLGVQGAGKSLAAKCVAGSWRLPLFRLDFGQLYGKYHGESETNLRNALNIAQTIAPCVLWMDEIEKGLATDAGDGDGGVSRRMLATLLTWMNERKEPVFIVATANDITSLPPELMRKGRFDEIFFVDLPDDAARRQIVSIHLVKRRLEPALFDLGRLAELTTGYSGAEIEQAIVAAGYAAHADRRPLRQSDVENAITGTQPLSVVMAEQISALRTWASSRTVPAN